MAVDNQYFRLPSVFWMVSVSSGIALLTLATFTPAVVPHEYLGPIGWLTRYLVNEWPAILNILMVFTIASHTVEACCAVNTAKNKSIENPARRKWLISVFVFGYFSYRHLLAYKPNKSK
ncbi:transmembrane protein 254-like isoform X2 [Antedon mediterranea]|uniref:transmembrane protein 254-like isoform X2 n=1 Tax=Antedon mediterranea TaxID=105859 RepID=UPI003AF81DE7